MNAATTRTMNFRSIQSMYGVAMMMPSLTDKESSTWR